MRTDPKFHLPKKRLISFTEIIDGLTLKWLLAIGFGCYVGTVIFFSVFEYLSRYQDMFNPPICNFGELVYFNFITILTIGYGDLSPTGFFRVLSIVEAIIGLAIYSVTISVITLKMLLPDKNTIVFSKYAYYCTEDRAFLIIYLNTARQFITNLETTWYFKLNEDWHTGLPSRVPFITKSVQTFYLPYQLTIDEIILSLHADDCLRVGLSGNIGVASYSTYVQYNLDQLLVIPNREELKAYDGFYQVDQKWQTPEFKRYFHYCPQNVITLKKLMENCKS